VDSPHSLEFQVKSSVPFFGEYFVSAVDSQMYFTQGQPKCAVHEFYNSFKLTRIDRQKASMTEVFGCHVLQK